jgi:hypothetical protein
MLDITEVNIYIMYLNRCHQGRNPVCRLMIHLQFKNTLCEALLLGWPRRTEINNDALTKRPSIHMPSYTTLKRQCVVCKTRTPHIYCYQCGFKFMCWKEECYQKFHEALARHH